MNNTQPTRIMPLLITALIVIVIAGIVLAAIGADATGTIAVLAGLSVALATIGVVLVRVASTPIVKIQSILLERQKEANRHEETMVKSGLLRSGLGYKPIAQIAAPPEQVEQKQVETDPRHALLISLTMLTIRSAKYGPTSEKLMTADDAQAQGGNFADRMNWDAASKYGQSIGLLWVKQGGKQEDQGLRISKQANGRGGTAADLIEVLVSRNTVLDSAVNALPGVNR